MIAIAVPRGGLTFNRAIIWAAQIALGMRYLHELSPPIVHGDLKTTNVLLTSDLTVKLSDINISAVKANAAAGRNTFTAGISADTIKFMAPERLEGAIQTIAGDVYSFAMTLYELLTAGSQPFSLDGLTTDSQVVTAVIIDRRRPTRPPDASLCPDAMWSLIQRCWDDEPGARPTFRTIVDMLAVMSEDVAALVAQPPEKVTLPEDVFKAPAAREMQLSPMRNKDRLTWESWHTLSMQPQSRTDVPRIPAVSIAARAGMGIHFVLTLTLAVVLILVVRL
ncbi:kinase-like domain-containing protein [Cladochytrium replicatum]|nr:kinase-like domain-containing protein [Cladochytrium replicatum]